MVSIGVSLGLQAAALGLQTAKLLVLGDERLLELLLPGKKLGELGRLRVGFPELLNPVRNVCELGFVCLDGRTELTDLLVKQRELLVHRGKLPLKERREGREHLRRLSEHVRICGGGRLHGLLVLRIHGNDGRPGLARLGRQRAEPHVRAHHTLERGSDLVQARGNALRAVVEPFNGLWQRVNGSLSLVALSLEVANRHAVRDLDAAHVLPRGVERRLAVTKLLLGTRQSLLVCGEPLLVLGEARLVFRGPVLELAAALVYRGLCVVELRQGVLSLLVQLSLTVGHLRAPLVQLALGVVELRLGIRQLL